MTGPNRAQTGETARRVQRRILERVLRYYPQWRAAYEAHGVETVAHLGNEYHVLDILAGIDTLPPRQRQALTLTCLAGYTHEEAADLMGLPGRTSTIEQHKNAALDKLLALHEKADRAEHRRRTP